MHELLDRYLASRFLKAASVYQMRFVVDDFCRDSKISDVDQVTKIVILRYAQGCLARGLSPHTVGQRVARLGILWRYAEALGLCKAEKLPPIKRPRVVIRATPTAEVRRLVKHCETLAGELKGTNIPKGIYWSAYAAASYETALRTSDLLQLRWRSDGRWSLIQRKTGNPVTITVWPETLERIRELSQFSPNLFDVGWSREWYCRGLVRIAKNIGVRVTPQQLRRSAISEAERIRPGAGARLAGHIDDGTTRRWYFDHGYIYGDVRGPRVDATDDK